MSRDKLTSYGGQAVIEGVMMRGENAVAIAMRSPQQEIVLHTEPLGDIYKSKIIKIPFLRGVIALWDALILGMRALTISANLQGDEDEQLEGPALYLTLAFSLALSIGLFFLVPAAAGHCLQDWLNFDSNWMTNLVEGLLRLAILVGYIWGVGRMEDIKRVFSYHGAEHKTINAVEAGVDLSPEEVSKQSVKHPRCGTAFILTVVVFSILLFSLVGPFESIWIKLGVRILLIPVLATIAYEYTRWTARNLDNPLIRLLIKPNLALQHLTTNEPDLAMLEVAITSFKAMQEKDVEYAVV
ncbi:MAG: DUF1385 domain-containing protein [Anaerolineales bacterium]|jgi:uncharacterized protein YqhQ